LRPEIEEGVEVLRCQKCWWIWRNNETNNIIKDRKKIKEEEVINNIKRLKAIEDDKAERIEEAKRWDIHTKQVNKLTQDIGLEYPINPITYEEVSNAILALRFVMKTVRIYKRNQAKSDKQLIKDEQIQSAKIWAKLNQKDGLDFRKIAKDFNLNLATISRAVNKIKKVEADQNNTVNLKVNIESKKAQPKGVNL